jgi:cytochrome P450
MVSMLSFVFNLLSFVTDIRPGSSLRSGTPIGIPINCIHHDNVFYPEADRFDGFRFYKLRQQGYQGVSVTDVSTEFLTFGYGSRAWYATLLLSKILLPAKWTN